MHLHKFNHRVFTLGITNFSLCFKCIYSKLNSDLNGGNWIMKSDKSVGTVLVERLKTLILDSKPLLWALTIKTAVYPRGQLAKLWCHFFRGKGHFVGMQTVADKRREGSKIAQICRCFKWMVPQKNSTYWILKLQNPSLVMMHQCDASFTMMTLGQMKRSSGMQTILAPNFVCSASWQGQLYCVPSFVFKISK